MKIVEITVSSGTTFNHPHEQYCNFRPSITLKASVVEENIIASIIGLQETADKLVRDHRKAILDRIARGREVEHTEYELERLQHDMKEIGLALDKVLPGDAAAGATMAEEIRESGAQQLKERLDLCRRRYDMLQSRYRELTGSEYVLPPAKDDDDCPI